MTKKNCSYFFFVNEVFLRDFPRQARIFDQIKFCPILYHWKRHGSYSENAWHGSYILKQTAKIMLSLSQIEQVFGTMIRVLEVAKWPGTPKSVRQVTSCLLMTRKVTYSPVTCRIFTFGPLVCRSPSFYHEVAHTNGKRKSRSRFEMKSRHFPA